MTAWPSPVLAWARALALPEDAVAALAPWLARWRSRSGPLTATGRDGAGEPDGVDGLTRRGGYERLLLSEWALADELPDEFLRRAAGGEHLFVARAHRRPPARRRTLALLSAGPAQLGAPRLVHLAALLVLGRRAAAAGATLRWGVLERPGDGAVDGVDRAGVVRLVAARTAHTAGAAEVAAWRAAELASTADDLWLVGGPEVEALARARTAAARSSCASGSSPACARSTSRSSRRPGTRAGPRRCGCRCRPPRSAPTCCAIRSRRCGPRRSGWRRRRRRRCRRCGSCPAIASSRSVAATASRSGRCRARPARRPPIRARSRRRPARRCWRSGGGGARRS
ncbi:MAG: hypothetical protein H6708_31360 [Kofleriaceae bacterium]|nr:hypothetical protein [Kofleriaceae bacterium]